MPMRCLILVAFTLSLLAACEPGASSSEVKSPSEEKRNDAAKSSEPTLAEQIAAVRRGETTKITVSNAAVTDADIQNIAALETLTHLILNRSQVTDASLPRLAALPKLELLRIASPHVTDAGLASISGSPSLRFLILQDAAVTDAGLLELKGMTQLESLYLMNTQVTEAGVAALAEHLPGLHVHW